MRYNDKIFREQFPIVKLFLYHLTCYRELHHTYIDLNLKSEFWTNTINAHLLQACILWCMVFGSHGCNPMHWKKMSDQDCLKLEKSFREGLYKHIAITQEEWNTYWNEMNDFRGGYAAHRELAFSKSVPIFKTAEEVAYFYDTWVREIIKPDVFDEPLLQESVLCMQQEIRHLAMIYLSETIDKGEHRTTRLI